WAAIPIASRPRSREHRPSSTITSVSDRGGPSRRPGGRTPFAPTRLGLWSIDDTARRWDADSDIVTPFGSSAHRPKRCNEAGPAREAQRALRDKDLEPIDGRDSA